MDYIPRRLASLRDWSANFAGHISSDPALYGLTGADAAVIQGAVDAFIAAYRAATDPSTRTMATVARMRSERLAMTAIVRRFAAVVRAAPSITAQRLSDLGLTIPDTTPTPIPAPDTFPLLDVLHATPGRHELRFSDSATPDKRAKPYGAVGLQLFRVVGDERPASPEEARLVGQFSVNPVRVNTPIEEKGKTARYYARWVTRTGLTGPWSSPVAFTIAA